MHAVLKKLGDIGIIPVIKIDDASRALPLAEALIAGGIPCAEVTFRTAAGEAALRAISAGLGGKIVLGAGTVLTTEQVDRAVDAGASFIVSPGFNPKVVSHAQKRGVPITPGCSSPSDMEAALEAGLEVVKFFPAEQAGGLAFIKAVAAPYGSLRFIPTGGINASNVASYLMYEKILACGGSWMVPPDLINAGNFESITALCKEAQQKVHGFSVVHIGINAANAESASHAAALFGALFGFPVRDGASSLFASDGIEIMKGPYLGANGHIAVAVNNVLRAKAYLEAKGAVFNEQSAKPDGKGGLIAVYLKDDIAGFAVHLVQKK
ncbi:MAG: bifunctional 4-hydroxy-2-oxoglutarate aldolase/2-dehydro-3-deoxy-phosphogluconate aldolase [Treponema sp.]|jgi:2-dehydro-3-deoxyphosphogluconate aldolase/(4S)-4-hydroxy-2-oxoglutarate aldolase|nr:bifunctional 4-hydroxy-2-oxoglutarate aldolase/2-dehydro-3-deoxy-phosphogluconate aldolase [Treponema sp.]